MPFVRKIDSQGSQPSTNAQKLFIGRTGELLFFVQNILKPEEPTHNIISIWGQGGVGKSTLLARFIDEARSANFKDYCLTATVDEELEDHIYILTRSFVEEFNRLSNPQSFLILRGGGNGLVVLLLVTFDQLGPRAVVGMLDYLREADIRSSVVLVIAGRDPIE